MEYKLENVGTVIGIPGCGKTTLAEKRIEDILKKEPDARILFLTFTENLANETRKRFQKFSRKDNEEFDRDFRVMTLHGYALKIVMAWAGKNRYKGYYSVITPNELIRKLNKHGDWEINMQNAEDGEHIENKTQGDLLYKAYVDFRRETTTASDIKSILPAGMGVDIFQKFLSDVEAVKQENREIVLDHQLVEADINRIDFEDFFIEAIKNGCDDTPHWDYLFIDETQDITPLGFAFIENILMYRVRNLLVLGDPNQSMYEFMGAKPNLLLDFIMNLNGSTKYIGSEPENIVRMKTHRCPQNIIDFAHEWVHRGDTEALSRPAISVTNRTGKIETCDLITDFPFQVGEKYMILARYNHFLQGLEDFLMEKQVSFSYTGRGIRLGGLGKFIMACRMLEDMRRSPKAKIASRTDFGYIFLFTDMFGRDWLENNSDRIEKALVKNMFSLEDTGLQFNLGWEETFSTAPKEYIDYVKACKDSGQSFDENLATVRLMTLHKSKGLETNVVLLLTDIKNSDKENPDFSLETERKIWNVGMTRPRKHLIFTKRYPQTPSRAYMEFDI